jgi:hypothetical protein
MTPDHILRLRFENQRIARAGLRTAEDVVAWFGAMQAQDYLGSLWAIGQRMRTASEANVEAAETRRAIVRTWPMRGTLHFVAAEDARWITRLLAPRVIARNAARLKREVDVHAAVIARSREVVMRALEGGKRLERGEMYEALEARRIRTAASRGLHILLWLALEGTLCLAGRNGKQHTFALAEDWLPNSPLLERDEAFAELARRYFTSHGPATIRDFMWWAGITAKDAQSAIDGAGPRLVSDVMNGTKYWFGGGRGHRRGASTVDASPSVKLLPAFDEYTVAYQDRSLLVADKAKHASAGYGLLNPVVVIDGRVVGTWSRVMDKRSVSVRTRLQRKLTTIERDALQETAKRYAAFLGLEAKLYR